MEAACVYHDKIPSPLPRQHRHLYQQACLNHTYALAVVSLIDELNYVRYVSLRGPRRVKTIIRLLRFSTRESTPTNITACIQNWSLDSPETPSSTTVTYTWGPPSRLNAIELQGRDFPVLDQLYPFLKTISDAHDGLLYDSWWWMDSICINQADMVERSHQVQLMRRIYRGAAQTLVWLGKQSLNSNEAIEVLHFLCEQARGQHLTEANVTRLRSNHFRSKWLAKESLLQRPWWKRGWTVQKFIITKILTFCCGTQFFSRNVLRTGLVAVWLCGQSSRASNVELL